MEKDNYNNKIIPLNSEEKEFFENSYGKNNLMNLTPKSLNMHQKTLNKERGLRLNILRKSLGLNLKEFGDICKIESGMLGRYERGSTEIHETCVLKIHINIRSKLGYFVDPSWILNGNGFGLHTIDDNSEIQLKSIEDNVKQYVNSYSDYKESLSVYENNSQNNMFYGKNIIFGKRIDLKKMEDLLLLDNIECYVELNNKSIMVGHVSYDEDQKSLILKETSSKEFFNFQIADIKFINIIQGFVRNKENFNLSKII